MLGNGRKFGWTFMLCQKLLHLFFVRKFGRSSAELKVRSITNWPAKQALNSKQSAKGYERIIREILRHLAILGRAFGRHSLCLKSWSILCFCSNGFWPIFLTIRGFILMHPHIASKFYFLNPIIALSYYQFRQRQKNIYVYSIYVGEKQKMTKYKHNMKKKPKWETVIINSWEMICLWCSLAELVLF